MRNGEAIMVVKMTEDMKELYNEYDQKLYKHLHDPED